MFRPHSDFFSRQPRAGKQWLALVAGLTLLGAANGAPGSPGEADVDVPAAREADRPAPPADGALLTGTIVSSKSADARTIISDSRGHQRVYARGDEIPDGGEVVEIHRDYVLVRRGGRLERLEFSSDVVSPMSVSATPGTAHATPPEDQRKVLRRRMFSHPELLLQLVGATAVMEDGQFRGYRVMQPNDPAFLESLGLRPGDLLTAVNGVPLDTPDYGAQVIDAMSDTGELTFTVERGDQVLAVSD
jgi:general secretion pathway protein C